MKIFIEEAKKSKKELFDRLKTLNKKRGKVRYIVKEHTQWVDNLMKALSFKFLREKIKDFSIVALGGYGRKQLNPRSDIDIMVLVKDRSSVSDEDVRIVGDVLYALDYECGVSVRTISECVNLSEEDDMIKTSLFDSRFVCGSKKLFNEYNKILQKDIIDKNVELFVENKISFLKVRHKKFGNTVFVLEPNIKEGVGGLRDYNTLIWVSKAIFHTKNALDMKRRKILESEDYQRLRNALYFLWQLRNTLHFETGKETDILHLDMRESIAYEMGYKNSKNSSASEKLMRKYYYHTIGLKIVVLKYLELFELKKSVNINTHSFKIDDKIVIKGGKIGFYKEIERVEDIFLLFYYSALYGVPIEAYSLNIAHKIVLKYSSAKKDNRYLSFIFKEILSLDKTINKQIKKMHEIGLIDKYIPEFGNICCLSEYSLYHKYTVDEHSIKALEYLDELLYADDASENFLTRLKNILCSLSKHNLFILRLSLILHDIGKIKAENHELVGAELSKHIADRLGIGDDLKGKLVFLIKHHLLINQTISTKDIDDPKTLQDFINIVDSKDKLNMLMLMTFADMNAVNDNVWTTWRENLIESLYIKTLYAFDNKNYYEFLELHVKETKRRMRQLLDEHSILDILPNSIFNDENFDTLYDFIKTIDGTGKAIKVYAKDHGISKLFAYYKNEFGFFNKLTGISVCKDVNIISGKSYTLKNDMIINVFNVYYKKKELSPKIIDNFIEDVDSKKISLDECIKRRNEKFLSRAQKARIALSIDKINLTVDNEASDIYTSITIYAPDRMGLLYDITSVFLEFNLFIGMFILDTKGEIAVDTFYVIDTNSRKIYSKKKIDLIKSRIYEVLR